MNNAVVKEKCTETGEQSSRRLDVLVAGNANMDIIAKVPKLPKDDEKIRIIDLNECPGGSASNYSVAVRRLGGRSGFIGHLGNDDEGSRLLEAFKREGVDVSHVNIEEHDKTGFAFVVTSKDGNHVVFSYRGANALLNPEHFSSAYLETAWLLHLSSINLKVMRLAVKKLKGLDLLLSMDPGPESLFPKLSSVRSLLSASSILFLNQIEFKILTGAQASRDHVQNLANYLDCIVSVQRGGQGVLISDGQDTFSVAAFPVKVVDTIGAGDTYSSACTMALLRGYSLEEAAMYGCAAAGLKCQVEGARAGIPYHNQVIRFLHEQNIQLNDRQLNPG
ncbi:MAG: carbohydrate kinase family protein, partial [Candidatus Ranarchaeia archaeon]